MSEADGFDGPDAEDAPERYSPISVQRSDSTWFIEIQVRLVIFVVGKNRLANGVAHAIPDGKHGTAGQVVALACLLFG